MQTLLASLVAIAALDSLNPTATAIQVFLLSTPKPIARSTAFISGVFIAYWTVGLLVVLGLGKTITTLFDQAGSSIPLPLLYGLQFAIGIALLVAGCRLNLAHEQEVQKQPKQINVSYTFTLGLAVTIWESPTALPYLAALQQIIRADLDWHFVIAILGLYNFIFVLPLIVLLGVYIAFQNHSAALLSRINRSIQVWGPKALRVILIVLGIALVADSIAYGFGRPLF